MMIKMNVEECQHLNVKIKRIFDSEWSKNKNGF